MFIEEHESSGQYIFTYGDGDDFEEPQVVAITATEDEFYFYSEGIEEASRPLSALSNTSHREELPAYLEKRDVPQTTLDAIEDNRPYDNLLEEDSHERVDVERKLDMLDQGDTVTSPEDRHIA